ncbi:MAG: nucleoside triphosphate pyrophosphohydrolase [Muribaculaceae bacterium]|nr:nucleoside triphosphate pyrophosphohydrolase [Muribaculaceae bacterium]
MTKEYTPHTRKEKLAALDEFLNVLETLRVKCPWDRKQTNESLRPNTVEEVYELVDALMADDQKNICKELGDVLLHVGFYALIGEEKGEFDIADVCNMLVEKLKFRHPHIYGDIQADTAEEVKQNWEKIKLKERDGNKTVLGGVPSALPAMIKANRIQEKARNVGFDWEQPSDVWNKVREEVEEVQQEIDSNDAEKLEGEFGDLLFAVINAARLYGVDPENALEKTNRKFISRFNHIEKRAREIGKSLSEMTLEEMDALWNEAKGIK